MKHERKEVTYSYEHGNKSLPHLADLATQNPDPNKLKIVKYLETHCILTCAGIVYDEIHPDRVIGYGHLFSDGTYFWDDVFTNYVKQYNIPVPKEFRDHILANYDSRMGLHELLHQVDSVAIDNNPYIGYKFSVRINRNGWISYRNNTDCKDGVFLQIKAENAEYIIEPMMTDLFCYDSDEHGKPIIDGYHWKLTFYCGDNMVKQVEGWPGEDGWRNKRIKSALCFAERFVPKESGYKYMTEDDEILDDAW